MKAYKKLKEVKRSAENNERLIHVERYVNILLKKILEKTKKDIHFPGPVVGCIIEDSLEKYKKQHLKQKN